MNNEFNKKIESIRAVMNNMRMEKYAISVPDMVSLDDYHKSLYLKVLATVIQYENEITEMQDLYYGRIVCGTKSEQSQQDCMRMALEISEDDIAEFISFMSGSVAKYYFSLDGIILVSLSDTSQKGYDYLAELIELIGVGKPDLEHIALVAKSVLCLESSYYDEAKNVITEAIEKADFTPYIQNYYTGAIVDNQYCIHYSSPVRDNESFFDFQPRYNQSKVVFENVSFKINSVLVFEGCDEVSFINCNITGTYPIGFNACNKVHFYHTTFRNFNTNVLYSKHVVELIVENSEFIDCSIRRDEYHDNLPVFSFIRCEKNNDLVILKNTSFRNCKSINTNSNHGERYIITNAMAYTQDCKFFNCNEYSYLINCLIGENHNEVIGSTRFAETNYKLSDLQNKDAINYAILTKYLEEK